jgi:GWxTD domain-containing protein
MKKIFLIYIIFFVFIGLSAQEKNDDKTSYYSTAPNFNIDILNYKGDEEGKSRVDVFIQVPYPNIQFVKSGDKFVGSYSVNLIIMDEDKDNIIKSNLWEETVTASNFNQTSSQKNYNLNLKTFQLEPGNYFLRCIVEDKDSKRSVTSEHTMEVLPFDNKVDLSDLLLVSDFVESESGNRIIPNISQSVESMEEVIKFYYEAYSDEKRDVTIVYGIKDKNENQNYTHTITKTLDKGKNTLYGSLQYPSFTFGEYELSTVVKDSSGETLAAIGKSFYAKVFGIPRSVTNLQNAIDQMVYIAESSELSFINDGESFKERLERFLDYWKEKDPTPNTNVNEVMLEYYRRIDYSNRNFGAYKRDGWKTDMGMVYVSLGPPDYVDRHPFALESKPYEVWDYYNLNRQFVFVDYTGFGDYRLVNRNYRDLNRYHY